MKGHVKINITGEEVKLRLTAGVYEDFQEYCSKNDISDKESQEIQHQRIFFSLMELYGTDDAWKDPDILEKAKENSLKYKMLGFDQIQELMSLVDQISDEEGNPIAAGKENE